MEKDYWDGPEGMLDFCAGLGLLSGYEPKRFLDAMGSKSADEAEHLTAVAICILFARDAFESWMADRWYELKKKR